MLRMPGSTRRLILLLWLVLAVSCSAPPSYSLPIERIPVATDQVVLVVTDGWDPSRGWLQRWQRRPDAGWRSVGPGHQVSIGRSGLGWGLGLHQDGEGPRKHEGDGRSPAGLFRLGHAFGYAPSAPDGVRLAYRSADERDYFVDDVDSADYNRWRRIPEGQPNDPKARWQSCERMRRDDHVYEFGIVVEHNDACVPGRGSAIFVHVWQQPGATTSGCTAMSREDLLELLRWLDPDAQPLLLQVPESELRP